MSHHRFTGFFHCGGLIFLSRQVRRVADFPWQRIIIGGPTFAIIRGKNRSDSEFPYAGLPKSTDHRPYRSAGVTDRALVVSSVFMLPVVDKAASGEKLS
ncbi:MAG: hypothetical protein WBD20_18120 [Pirellulaceae bacterium]